MLSHFLILLLPDKTLFPVTPTTSFTVLPLLLCICWCVGFSQGVKSNEEIGVNLTLATNSPLIRNSQKKGHHKLGNILYHVSTTINTATTTSRIITSQSSTISQPNGSHTSGENFTHTPSAYGTDNLPKGKRIKDGKKVKVKTENYTCADSPGFNSRGSDIVPEKQDKQITESPVPSAKNPKNCTNVPQKDDVHIKIIDTDARNRRDPNPFRRPWRRRNQGRYWRPSRRNRKWWSRNRRRRWRQRPNMTTPTPTSTALVDTETGNRRVIVTQPGRRRRPNRNQTGGSTSTSRHGVFTYWNVPPFVMKMRRKLEQKIRQMSYMLYNGLSDTLYDISRRSKYLIRKYAAIKEDAKLLISDTHKIIKDIVVLSNMIYDNVLSISAFDRRLFERLYEQGRTPTAGSIPDISDFIKRDYNEFNREAWYTLRTARHMLNKFSQLNHTYSRHINYYYDKLDRISDVVSSQRIRIGDLMDMAMYVNDLMGNLTAVKVPNDLRQIYDKRHELITDNYHSRHQLYLAEQIHQDVTKSQKSCHRRLQELSQLNYTFLKSLPRPTTEPLTLKERKKLQLLVNRAEGHKEKILRTAAEIDELLPPLIKSGTELILRLSMESQSDSPEVRAVEKKLKKWGKITNSGKSKRKWMEMRRKRIRRMRKRMPKLKYSLSKRHRRSVEMQEEEVIEKIYDEIIDMLTEIIKRLDDMWTKLFKVSSGGDGKCKQIDAEGSGEDDTEVECEIQGSGKMDITESESGTTTSLSLAGNTDDDDGNDFEFTDVKTLVVSSHREHLQSIISTSLSRSKAQHKTSRNLVQDVKDIKSSIDGMKAKKMKLESDVNKSSEVVGLYHAYVTNVTEMRRLLNETEEKINESQMKCLAAQKLADRVMADKDELERLLKEKIKANEKEKKEKEKKEIQEDNENVTKEKKEKEKEKKKKKKKKIKRTDESNENVIDLDETRESEEKGRKDRKDKDKERDVSKKELEENEKTKAELKVLIEKYLQLQKEDEEREKEEKRKKKKNTNAVNEELEDTKERKIRKDRRNKNKNRLSREDREKKNSKKKENSSSDSVKEKNKRKKKENLDKEMKKHSHEVNENKEKRKNKIGKRRKEEHDESTEKGEEVDVEKNEKKKSTENRKNEKNVNQVTDKITGIQTNEKGGEIDVDSVLEIKKNLEDVLKKLNQKLEGSKKRRQRHRQKRKRRKKTEVRNKQPSMDEAALAVKEMIDNRKNSEGLNDKEESENENEGKRKKERKKAKSEVEKPKEDSDGEEGRDEMKNEESDDKEGNESDNEGKRKKKRRKSKNEVENSKKDSDEEEGNDEKKNKELKDEEENENEIEGKRKKKRRKSKNEVKNPKKDSDEEERNDETKNKELNGKEESENENEGKRKKKRRKSKNEVENSKKDSDEKEGNDEKKNKELNDEEENENENEGKRKKKRRKSKNEVENSKKDSDEKEGNDEKKNKELNDEEENENENEGKRKKKRRKSKNEVENSKKDSDEKEGNDEKKNKELNDEEENENENEGKRKKKRRKSKNEVKNPKKDSDEEERNDEKKNKELNDKEESENENEGKRKKKRRKSKNEVKNLKKDSDEEEGNDETKNKELNDKEESENENKGKRKKKRRKSKNEVKNPKKDSDEEEGNDEKKNKELDDEEENVNENDDKRKKKRKKSKNEVKNPEEKEGNDEMKKKQKKDRNGKKQTEELIENPNDGWINNSTKNKNRKKDGEKDEKEVKNKKRKEREKNNDTKKKRKKDMNDENNVNEEVEKKIQNGEVKEKKEKKDRDEKNDKKKGMHKNLNEKEQSVRERKGRMKDMYGEIELEEDSENNERKKKKRKKNDISVTMRMSLAGEGKITRNSSRGRKGYRKKKRILSEKIRDPPILIQNEEQSLAEEMKNKSKQIEEDVSKSEKAVESIVKQLKEFSPNPCTSISKNVKQLRLNVSQIRQKIQLARTIVSSMKIPVSLNGKHHLEVMLDPKAELREIQTSVEICVKPKSSNSVILSLQANNSISYSLALVDSKPLLTILDINGDELQKLEAETKLIEDNWYQLHIYRMGQNFSLSVNPTGSKAKGITVQRFIPDFQPEQIPLSIVSLGGYPQNFPISNSEKLKGCIAYLNVNGHSTHIFSPFKSGAYPSICKTGCESLTNTSMVFEGNGFALLEHDFEETFTSVHLTFKTLQKNALLMSIKKNSKILLLVTLIEGNIQVESQVEFSGVAKQSQGINFSDGHPHTIQVTMIEDELEIKTSAEKVEFEDKDPSDDETLFDEGISLGGLVSNLNNKSKYRSFTGCLSNISIDNKLVNFLHLKDGRHVYQGDCQENAWMSCAHFTESSIPVTLTKYDYVRSISLMISANAQGVALFFERDSKFSIKVQLTTTSLKVFNYENEKSETIPKNNSTGFWHILHIEDQKGNIQITLDGEQIVDVAYKEDSSGWWSASNSDDFSMVVTVGGLPKDHESFKKSDTFIGSISTLIIQHLPFNPLSEFGTSNNLSVCAKPTAELFTNKLDCTEFIGG